MMERAMNVTAARTRTLRIWANLRSDERGLTLTELMVAVFLMTVVSVIFTTVLASAFQATKDVQGTALSNDEVRLVMQSLDRELRAAERICEPIAGNTSNRLEFRTRAYVAAAPTAGYRDVIYELRDDGTGSNTLLQKSTDDGVTWRTVIDGVENEGLGVPMFENQGDDVSALPSQGKVVTVTAWVDSNPNDRVQAQLATTEISGRNIWSPNNAGCS
jgi:type II secretory pathway component PulJ